MKAKDPIARDTRRAQRYARLQKTPQTTEQAERERQQREFEAKQRLRAWRLGEIARLADRRPVTVRRKGETV